MKYRELWASLFACLCAFLSIQALAQDIPTFAYTVNPGRDVSGQITATTMVIFGPGLTPAITGAPFSADHLYQAIETGTAKPIGAETLLRKIFRDASGRTRIELPLTLTGEPLMLVEINDPANGVYHVLDPVAKIAYRVKFPPQGSAVPGALSVPVLFAAGAGSKEQTVTQALETRFIEGSEANGIRITRTIPAGAVGNAAAMIRTEDIWNSTKLGIRLLDLVQDPTRPNGSSVIRFANVGLQEPDPSVFQVPADYKIVGKGYLFNLSWGAPIRPSPDPGSSDPMPLQNGGPEYPQEVRDEGISSTVRITYTIDENGTPKNIKIVQSLDPRLDLRALSAVRKWRFLPARKDGEFIPVDRTSDLTFR